jgi:hypothetical protein
MPADLGPHPNMADDSTSEVIALDQELPAPWKSVVVVCQQFRLLGYRDEKGIWRESRRPKEELKDVPGWHEVDE